MGTGHSPLGGKWPQDCADFEAEVAERSQVPMLWPPESASPPPEHSAELLGRTDPAQHVFQRLLPSSPTVPTCQSEALSFASLICIANLHDYPILSSDSFIVKGLSCPAAFCHLRMLPQPWAKAWPRLERHMHSFS